MKCIVFFLVVTLTILMGCNFNETNRIRFVLLKSDAAPGQLRWNPDGDEKEEDTVEEELIIDGGNNVVDITDADSELSTLESCNNYCHARYGCRGNKQCEDLLVTCLIDCGVEIFPHDAQ